MSDGTPGDGEVLSPEEYLREHGADGVEKIRHKYDPASSLLAPDPDEREVETLRRSISASQMMRRNLQQMVDEREAALRRVEEERDALAKFKAYVHQRLDEAGVSKDPESPHKAAGCRIGGRLDEVLAAREQAGLLRRQVDGQALMLKDARARADRLTLELAKSDARVSELEATHG
jgi:hypothetical protein